ncbi:MAG TPA: tRNA (adenosine(37)-N6)-dimethylallyltransferase MiaA [Candidatus Methanoperedens sp.]|nr:tRNA (adenosine(37)-N6)-dimethylallyltransferase MiaA [Candidatus Methanoperedens sp.]
MIKKILIISGPTATGKTDLAIELAKKYNGVLISADSRQIYQGMDIGTGKDHPKDLSINLIDLIPPSESFSVAQYQKMALKKITEIHSKNKLPIIVGGTGQYIDSIINQDKSTYFIKPNNILRFFLNKLSTPTLQKIFQILDKKTFESLNNSEQHNPHRLIRKIEIRLLRRFTPRNDVIANNKSSVIANNKSSVIASEAWQSSFNILHLSLTAPTSFLYPRVDARVQKRLEMGLLGEIKNILKKYSWSVPGLNTLAYKEFKEYFLNKKSLDSCIEKWRFGEHAYVRRQITWFKKQKNIVFIDISDSKCMSHTLLTVKKWYNLS